MKNCSTPRRSTGYLPAAIRLPGQVLIPWIGSRDLLGTHSSDFDHGCHGFSLALRQDAGEVVALVSVAEVAEVVVDADLGGVVAVDGETLQLVEERVALARHFGEEGEALLGG